MPVPRPIVRVLPLAWALLAAMSLPAILTAQRATHGPADSAAVILASETLLRAISTRDTAMARPLLLAGGTFTSAREGASGAAPTARLQTFADFMQNLPNGKERFLERMWSPSVWFDGPLAEVRARYDFHIDGVFSHCGVDVFTLLQTAGGWRIAGVSYSVRPTGCAPSPLGPPN